MKKILTLLLLVCLGGILSGAAQPPICVEPGTVFEYAQYNAKDKLTGFSQRSVVSVRKMPDGTLLVTEEEQQLDTQRRPAMDENTGYTAQPQTVLTYVSDTTMRIPLNEMLYALVGGVPAGVDVKITGDENLVYPLDPADGQKLPDTRVSLTASQSGQSFSITLLFDERSVLGREKIQVPAGEYQTLKISERQTAMAIMFSQTEVEVSWYAPGIGVVRSENLSKGGKLIGYSTLMKILKPEE